jgi:hypothetical protein
MSLDPSDSEPPLTSATTQLYVSRRSFCFFYLNKTVSLTRINECARRPGNMTTTTTRMQVQEVMVSAFPRVVAR